MLKVWEQFRVYKMVERECERIEAEVREQVEQEMQARKDAKKKKAAVASFDDVKGWERRIREPIQCEKVLRLVRAQLKGGPQVA